MRQKPEISIVITAHNAEETIRECLESIAADRGFEPEKIEIILIDDRSRDNTAAAARGPGLTNLKIISIDSYEDHGLTARQVALDAGFHEARGDIILVTDADAVVPADWIQNMAGPLRASRMRGTAGMITFKGEKKWPAKLQSVDAICYFSLSRLLNRLGFKGGIFFGNFAFRKEVYEKTGGFKILGFALTEDLLFYRAMRRHGFPVFFSKSGAVTVRAADNWRELIKRTKRVSSGGFSLLSLLLGLWLVSFILLLVLTAVTITTAGGNPVILMLSAFRYLAGVGFAGYAVLSARRFSLLPLIFIYELAVIALGLLTLLSTRLKKRVEWGGIRYER
jgi:cellulose synthase/poly-beta-1,6-N-acetylglucosamine synthase-like glycosyltransferase